jgi:hypothetical protein
LKLASLCLAFALFGCGSADELGIGAVCSSDADCGDAMVCLMEFKGGACGLKGCNAHADCPDPGLCAEIDGQPICLRSCSTKADCNANRPIESEANCSANLTLVEASSSKACVPPAGS